MQKLRLVASLIHYSHCWQLISTGAAYIIISTVTSKGDSKSPFPQFLHKEHQRFPIIQVPVRGGFLYTQCQNGCHVQHHIVPITEVTFSLRTSTPTHILRSEYIVNTLCFAALYTLQLNILQPHFTFCITLRFMVQQL